METEFVESVLNCTEETGKDRLFPAQCEPDLPGVEVEKRFRFAVKFLQRSEAAAAFYLSEIDERRIWRELGYSSVIAYASAVAGIAAKKAYALLNIGRGLKNYPVLRTAFDEGRIGWTKVRELMRLKGSFDEEKLLERALTMSNRELEKFISTANEAARRLKRSAIADLERKQELIFADNETLFPASCELPAGNSNPNGPDKPPAIPESLSAAVSVVASGVTLPTEDKSPVVSDVTTEIKLPTEKETKVAKSERVIPLHTSSAAGDAEVPADAGSHVHAGIQDSTISVTLKFTPEEYVKYKETRRIWKQRNRPAWKQERMVLAFAERYLEEETMALVEKADPSFSGEATESLAGEEAEPSTGEPACDARGKEPGSHSVETSNEQIGFPKNQAGSAKQKTGFPGRITQTDDERSIREIGHDEQPVRKLERSAEIEGDEAGAPGNSAARREDIRGRRKGSGRPVVESPFNLLISLCPDCGKSTMTGKSGDRIEVDLSLTERALCDGSVYEADGNGQPGRKKRSVSPALRKKIFMRDGGVCRTPGCGRTSFLEVHHIKPLSECGGNNPANLLLTCSLCHKNIHEGRLRISGTQPELEFRHVGKIDMSKRLNR